MNQTTPTPLGFRSQVSGFSLAAAVPTAATAPTLKPKTSKLGFRFQVLGDSPSPLKPKTYNLIPIIALALLAAPQQGLAAVASAAASPAVPLRWTAETSRVSPARLEAVRGETLALAASFTSYGQPLPMDTAPCQIFWQTNGMGAVYWSADASATGNVVYATFSPTMDPGAAQVRGFLGQPGKNYRAAFAIRFLDGPGETPNVLPLPTQRIDFSTVEVLNAPWLTTNNLATYDKKIDRLTDMTTANTTSIGNLQSSLNSEVTRAQSVETQLRYDHDNLSKVAARTADLAPYAKTEDLAAVATSGDYNDLSNKPAIPTVPTKVSELENDADYLTKQKYATEITGVINKLTGDINTEAGYRDDADTAIRNDLNSLSANTYTKSDADAAFYPADDGQLWASWWSGDGFRVAVSNYDVDASAAAWDRLPAAAFEYRPGGTGNLVRVWDERTRWDRHRADFVTFTNAMDAALAGKADLDWGKTSPLGAAAPVGFTWFDTPAVAIAGGLSWQKTLTSEGAFWLLCSNGMVANFGSDGASTNGYFRITDEKGNAMFEIVAGDKVTAGADPASIFLWDDEEKKTHMRVVYNVVSDAPPTLYFATTLNAGKATTWYAESAEGCPVSLAGWTGSSGAWTNAFCYTDAFAANDRLFVMANYQQGVETYVKNHAPVSMSKLVLNGVTYTLGTATIDGHTVLTLTPQGGN